MVLEGTEASQADIINSINILNNKKYNLNAIDNSQTVYSKIEYREIEHNKLKNINTIINTIYYCFIILLFMLLYTNNDLHISERYIFYIFIIALPYIYPWIFMFIVKIKNVIAPTINNTGPKNAFIDVNNSKYIYDI